MHSFSFIGIEGNGGIFSATGLDNRQLLNVAGSADRTFKVCDFNRLDENVKNAIAAQICTGESNPNKLKERHSKGNLIVVQKLKGVETRMRISFS